MFGYCSNLGRFFPGFCFGLATHVLFFSYFSPSSFVIPFPVLNRPIYFLYSCESVKTMEYRIGVFQVHKAGEMQDLWTVTLWKFKTLELKDFMNI